MSFTNDFKDGVGPYRQRVNAVIRYLLVYLKNPISALREIPDWEWPTLLIFYSGAAATSGILSGVVALSISQFIAGLLWFPIYSTFVAAAISGFIYYTYMFFFHREIPFKKIFTIVIFSLLPFLALYALSSIIPPINIVGFTASAILLSVGLSDNTQIDRKKIFKLVGGIYLVFIAFWVFNAINTRHENKKYKNQATPESIEKLKDEFGQ